MLTVFSMLNYTGDGFSVIEMFLKNEDGKASYLFEFITL